jgi:hypothetical protein
MGNSSASSKKPWIDSEVPEVDPRTVGQPINISLIVGASGNELILEVQVEGVLHQFLIDSGASLSPVKQESVGRKLNPRIWL